MRTNYENVSRMQKWSVASPEEEGFHTIFSPEISECEVSYVFRLNLSKGKTFSYNSGKLEMFFAVIQGSAGVHTETTEDTLSRLDGIYIPANTDIRFEAFEDLIVYVGGAEYEGIGKEILIRFPGNFEIEDDDLNNPPRHVIHGEGPFRREVYRMLSSNIPASRLICGFTFGDVNSFTSWPPHQHEETLEESYLYFDMPEPNFGFQITYLKSGEVQDCCAHPVRSGSMVNFPCGYHPTITTPGSRNIYMTVIVARKPEYRKPTMIPDPVYSNRNDGGR